MMHYSEFSIPENFSVLVFFLVFNLRNTSVLQYVLDDENSPF